MLTFSQEWKPGINPYHVRCRYSVHGRYTSPTATRKTLLSSDDDDDDDDSHIAINSSRSSRSNQFIKVAIQLFKVVPKKPLLPPLMSKPGSLATDEPASSGQQSHLLDIKLVQGEAFGFFDLSCKLVAALTPKL